MKASILIIVGALALGSCASSKTTQQPNTTQPTPAEPEAAEPAAEQQPEQPDMHSGMMGGNMADMCPMAVQGTTVRAEDVEGGAAIVFTGNASELRQRVARMAEMHNRHHGEGHGRGTGMAGGGMMMPPSMARSEDVEGGARLVFTPRDPAELAKLREHVRHHAERMISSGQCPMMHGQDAEEAPPSQPSEHETHHPEGSN